MLCSILFFSPENIAVSGIMWKKYFRAGQVTDASTAHASSMLDA